MVLFGLQDVARATDPRLVVRSSSPVTARSLPPALPCAASAITDGFTRTSMKAFFHRLHLGGGAKDKDRDSTQPPKEKFPPLRSWPPEEPQRVPSSSSTSTPNSVASFKPLPEIAPSEIAAQLSSRPLPPIVEPSSLLASESRSTITLSPPKSNFAPSGHEESPPGSSANTSESAGRSTRRTNGSTGTHGTSDVQKKVAFISPPPTPANFERLLSDAPSTTQPAAGSPPLKTTVSRFQATYGKEPRGSVSTGASSSKTDVATLNKTSVKATSTRGASPYLQKSFDGPSAQSLRSGTPYSSMSNNTSGSRILAAASWSEVTEDDLVSNIGSRERTRQEVLFEIISSEDRYGKSFRSALLPCSPCSRYVQELVKMKDTFIDPLLHPYSLTPASTTSTPNLDYDYYRAESPFESTDDLPPIAARFMSPTPSQTHGATSPRPRDAPHIDGESLDTDEEDEAQDRAGRLYDATRRPGTSTTSRSDHPRSPYRSTVTRSPGRAGGTSVPFPSRSHQSLPPPPRNPMSSSTHSLGRQSVIAEQEQRQQRDRKHSQGDSPRPGMLRKFKKSQTTAGEILGNAIAPHQLPEDLRICLEVIDSGVFDGHKRLSEALKKRYDDQYPLVRSLADVFVSNVSIDILRRELLKVYTML